MTTINHTITVTIDGVNRTSMLMKDSLYIRSSIANKGDTASFTTRSDGDDYAPLDWDEVIVSINGTAVFGGYIINRRAFGVGSGSTKAAHWEVECKDWTVLLDQTIVDCGYTDTADTAIVADLFDRYLPAEAFDNFSELTTVDNDVDVYFENVTLRAALNTLAASAKANWHIAPDKTIYWYSPAAPGDAAFNIDTVAPNDSTTFDVLASSLQYGVDASTIINRVRIIGGQEDGERTSNVFDANGTQTRFGPLSYKPGSVWRVSYIVDDGMGGDVTRYIYPSAIGYEPEDDLIIDGGDYNVLVNLDERYLIIQEAGGVVPKAATSVSVIYYKLTQVDVTRNDEPSQAEYGRVFEKVIYDESLNTSVATNYADNILGEYAAGRETIRFDVTEHGLLPGRLITVNAPVLGSSSTYGGALALENRHDVLLLEDGTSRLMLESYGEARRYLIQDVTIRTVVTGSNQFMVIASVSCGKYIPTLLDSLAQIQQFSAGTDRLPARRTTGSLDRISNNLGEVVAGRATFTDGGTAPFTWNAYNDHTGVVIGLEDTDTDPYGAMYILDDGAVKAKVGNMVGMPTMGGITPTGWGIWTENGYFSGVITASEMIGGTISTTSMPINSSNPGVYMTAAGIFAYGTLGLTFALPSDPTQRPVFSSGTILNTVYEVTTASVLRTGTINPRVQIDNSGIFAYDSGGTARFTVDANTGKLTASQGTFSGTVSASTVTGSTVSGGTVTGAVFTGGTVTQGTVSAATISGGTVTGALVTGGTVSAASGNLFMTSTGLNFVAPSSYVIDDTRNIKWRKTSSGSVVVEVTGVWNGSEARLYNVAGINNNTYGWISTQAHNNSGFGYTEIQQYPTQWTFIIDGNSKMQIDTNVTTWLNIIPDSSANNRQLGDSTHGFRYLYLKDDSGSVRRVSINSSGVLTVT